MAMHCLIVDDSAYFLQAVRLLLERERGVVVDIASTGADAIAHAEMRPPDVILLDINLGTESGFDVARQIDRWTGTKVSNAARPRIILISTHAEEDFSELVADSPAVGFISKSALSAGAIQELLSSAGG